MNYLLPRIVVIEEDQIKNTNSIKLVKDKDTVLPKDADPTVIDSS